MRPPLKQPCRECPFNRDSAPGYLGADDPVGFMAATLRDSPMPCHMTVDYEDPDWRAETGPFGDARQCAGAAIFFSNICKLSRDLHRDSLPSDRETVFSTPQEFIDHHDGDASTLMDVLYGDDS